jgi:hypothetical protein
MAKLSSVAVLEKVEVAIGFACHVCVAEGEVLTTLADALLSDDELVLVVTLSKVEYILHGSILDGVLSGTFKSSKGLEGTVTATKHKGSYLGSYTYMSSNYEMVERKIRLVTI